MDATLQAVLDSPLTRSVGLILLFQTVAAVAAWRAVRRLERRLPTPERITARLADTQWRLLPPMFVLCSDTLEILTRDLAPGRPLALFLAAEPPLLMLDRGVSPAFGPEAARWIELHLARLEAGQTVRDICGTLRPLAGDDGRLLAVLTVAGPGPVPADEREAFRLQAVRGLFDRVGAEAARLCVEHCRAPLSRLRLPRPLPGFEAAPSDSA